jgi:hypothetical protein
MLMVMGLLREVSGFPASQAEEAKVIVKDATGAWVGLISPSQASGSAGSGLCLFVYLSYGPFTCSMFNAQCPQLLYLKITARSSLP